MYDPPETAEIRSTALSRPLSWSACSTPIENAADRFPPPDSATPNRGVESDPPKPSVRSVSKSDADVSAVSGHAGR